MNFKEVSSNITLEKALFYFGKGINTLLIFEKKKLKEFLLLEILSIQSIKK